MTKDDFITLVKETRERTSLSGEKLAGRLGVSFMTVQRWERGRTMPKADAIEHWVAALRAVEVQK